MSKITSTQNIKALKASIKHWNQDILQPLIDGGVIARGSDDEFRWKNGVGDVVKCDADSCALCKLHDFANHGEKACEECFLDCLAFDSPYKIFIALKY